MDSYSLVAVSLKGTPYKEPVMFYSSMEYKDIIIKAMQAFKLSAENYEDYMLFMPRIGCYVRCYEHLIDTQLLSLEEKEREKIQTEYFIKILLKRKLNLKNRKFYNDIRLVFIIFYSLTMQIKSI